MLLFRFDDQNWPESEEFYNLMQTYRHTPVEEQQDVVEAYEAVKKYLLEQVKQIVGLAEF